MSEEIDDDDDICPECGADWGNGESCDEDCDVQAAYDAEMADEDEDFED